MKLFIKNMVCNRCISAVETILKSQKINYQNLHLGEVEIVDSLTKNELQSFENELNKIGFEVLESQTKQQIEKAKSLIIQKIAELDIDENFLLSEFLAQKLNRAYSSISKTFSQNETVTLEQYFILQKMEKVKELLLYNEFNLTEIAGKLGYKSVQHLSSQFKNSTGFTPSEFKKLKNNNRKSIDFS